jgi:excisionase family DNA binding protein
MATSTLAPSPLLITKREAAGLLGISERTLHDLTKTGTIPAVRLGIRGVRYSVRALEAFIEKQLAATPA